MYLQLKVWLKWQSICLASAKPQYYQKKVPTYPELLAGVCILTPMDR
jgi:hypothetical protein